MMRFFNRRPLRRFVQGSTHSAQLLQEKFACAGCTLISGDDICNAAGFVQGVYHKSFATGGYDGGAIDIWRFNESIGIFDGLRFGN